MHGTRFLGHPLHPVLTDIPVGAWTVGVLADWLFVATGRLPAVAGDLALAIGVAGAILAALTGYTDFHETDGHERRTAIVHGLTMTAVLLIELVSLGMRLGAPGLRPGAIVLLHDGDGYDPEGDRTQTAKALPGIIEDARSAGYEFAPLHELLNNHS